MASKTTTKKKKGAGRPPGPSKKRLEAKVKQQTPTKKKEKTQSEILKESRDKINKGVKGKNTPRMITFEDDPKVIKANVLGYISSGSIAVDRALINGGYPRGRIVENFGFEGVAKSTSGYAVIKECQTMGGTALLIDTERTATEDYCRWLGIDTSKDGLQTIQDKNIERVMESLYRWLENVQDYRKPIVILHDTIAGTSTAHADTHKPGEKKVADMATILHKEFRQLNDIFTENDILYIATNRRYSQVNTSRYGGVPDEPKTYGGTVFPFWASTRMEITKVMGDKQGYLWPWDLSDVTGKSESQITMADIRGCKVNPIGMLCEVKVYKNKCGKGQPGAYARFCLQYGYGFNNYWSLYHEFLDAGYISPANRGHYHYFTDKDPELSALNLRWKYGHFGFEYLFSVLGEKGIELYNFLVKKYNELGYKAKPLPSDGIVQIPEGFMENE